MAAYLLIGASVLVAAALGLAAAVYVYRHFYVSVMPDEYVIHYGRGGRIKHCGRGISFFCWPGENFISVPTTIRDVNFCADQITKEKQGVRVQGFLAYRIEDFEKAYTTLDLRARTAKELPGAECNVKNNGYKEKNRERVITLDANDPLAKTDVVLRRLAESVVRHEVSNKTVDEMISEREAVIESMKDQIAPTVARWGLVVETIEFTEVWIRSKELFENLQADYRNQVRLKAEQSTADTERAIAESRLESEREVARMNAEAQRFQRVVTSQEQLQAREVEIKNAEEERAKELEMEQRLREKEIENSQRVALLEQEKEFEKKKREEEFRQAQELMRKANELARQQEEHKLRVDERLKLEELKKQEAETARLMMELAEKARIEKARLERERAEVALQQAFEAERQALEIKRLQAQEEAERVKTLAEAERERILRETEALERRGEVEAVNEKRMIEARNLVEQAQLQAMLIQQLAAVASSIKLNEVNWFNMSGDGKSPLGIIPENILQLLGVFKGMGIDVDGLFSGGARSGNNDSMAMAAAAAGTAGTGSGEVHVEQDD